MWCIEFSDQVCNDILLPLGQGAYVNALSFFDT